MARQTAGLLINVIYTTPYCDAIKYRSRSLICAKPEVNTRVVRSCEWHNKKFVTDFIKNKFLQITAYQKTGEKLPTPCSRPLFFTFYRRRLVIIIKAGLILSQSLQLHGAPPCRNLNNTLPGYFVTVCVSTQFHQSNVISYTVGFCLIVHSFLCISPRQAKHPSITLPYTNTCNFFAVFLSLRRKYLNYTTTASFLILSNSSFTKYRTSDSTARDTKDIVKQSRRFH